MSSLQEHEEQTLRAFANNVEHLALVELERLETERKELDAALKLVNDSLRRVRRVVASLADPRPKGKAKPGRKDLATYFQLSPERREELMTWLRTLNGTPVNKNLVRDQLKWSDSYAGMSIRLLHDEGVLRLAGQEGQLRTYRLVETAV